MCIDAPHGGSDTGQYDGTNYEKTQMLSLADSVKNELESAGVTVVMTRTTDTSVDYTKRIEICNNAKAAALVSFHRDITDKSGSSKGISAWIHTSSPSNSKSLASDIMEELNGVDVSHKKAANDAAKGKIFTRLGKEIMVAVKEGGPDVNNNSKLRQVVTKCKAANMPNDTIERAIKKAASTDMSNFESVTYEGYGPNGTAIIVEALTDNRNRAASNIRNAFTKGGGNVGTPGCVSFMFDNKGQIIVAKEDCDKDADDLMMIALDAGADDFNEEEDSYEITTAPDDFGTVSDALSNEGITFASAEVTMIPQTMVELTSGDDIKKMRRILALLDEEDDVQNVYHNWDEPIEDEE